MRLFFINEKGVEQTIQFALQNWWLADILLSQLKFLRSYIQAVEQSEVISLDFLSQEEMLHQFPQMKRYCKFVYQRAHAASQFRIKSLYTLSREEHYHQFIKQYPEFVQRIPQYLLASFLGFRLNT